MVTLCICMRLVQHKRSEAQRRLPALMLCLRSCSATQTMVPVFGLYQQVIVIAVDVEQTHL